MSFSHSLCDFLKCFFLSLVQGSRNRPKDLVEDEMDQIEVFLRQRMRLQQGRQIPESGADCLGGVDPPDAAAARPDHGDT